MTADVVEPRRWPLRRRVAIVLLLLGAQVGLVFWLSDRRPVHQRAPGVAPSLGFVGSQSDELDYSEAGLAGNPPHPVLSPTDALLALADPTLFALPHERGFSGQGWLWTPLTRFRPFAWSQPLEWLPPSAPQWGGAFRPVIESNPFGIAAGLEASPELTLPEIPPLAPARERSIYRIEGELANRRLLTPLSLKSWVTNDLLTNTIVQMVVDAEGRPLSAMLLSPCGAEAADQLALEQSQAARFESVSILGPGRTASPLTDLTWGTIIFEWHTLPAPVTNSPPATP